MKWSMLMAILAPAIHVAAQTASDRPVILEGAAGADRQVTGLADAATEGEALNARTSQAATYAYAEASGTNDWSVALTPAPAVVVQGMRLMVKASTDNTGPVTITVNGSGPFDVVKAPSTALAANDVASGEVVTLVFDGTAFQLAGARRLQRRDCPPGSVEVNELYCIEQDQRDTLDYYEAALVCGNLNGRLCSWGEWFSACSNAAALGLNNMVGDWEWTNNAANSDLSARVVGQSSCSHAGVTNGLNFSRNFRCCFKR